MPKQPVHYVGGLHVHRLVRDLKSSIDFYVTALGFFFDHGTRDTAWLTRQDVLLTLALAAADDAGKPHGTGQRQAGFNPECGYFGWRLTSLAELEEAFEGFQRQRQALSAPPDATVGRTWFFLYDPDGYPISFSCAALDYPAGKLD